MSDYAELELLLTHYAENRYLTHVTRLSPGDQGEQRREAALPLRIDFAALLERAADAVEYGRELTRQLFTVRELSEELQTARGSGFPVRFRIAISSKAQRLQTIRWETLRDPLNLDQSLLTSERVLFSRHIFTNNGRPARTQRPENPRALVVIAAPEDLDQAVTPTSVPLAPIDREVETREAKSALKSFAVEVMPPRSDLLTIIGKLRSVEYDALLLVCHGAMVREQPYLILEDDRGLRDTVPGEEFVSRIADLRTPPSLIVMACCRSGSDGYTTTGEVVASLASSLASNAAIPAVIAMQGDVSAETASVFLAEFFDHFSRYGEVDWAMAVARGRVRDRTDAWMPVLHMRLLDGSLWPTGSSLAPVIRYGVAAETWGALLAHVRRGKCTPIIGFGVYEDLFGSAASLAQRWAEAYRYPLQEGDELPQIAQYLAVNHDPHFPRYQFEDHLRLEILRRADALGVPLTEAPLDGMIADGWQAIAKPDDPHRILARLPCSLYLTTNLSSILETALREAGVHPTAAVCKWNDVVAAADIPAVIDESRPLVYHLFGRFDDHDSIVVSEDDYFDYLVGATTAKDELQKRVRGMINNSALILLGFRITEWSLRVLFRSIMTSEGSDRRRNFTHVAVQVDPKQVSIAEPERVRAFLARYFERERITVFAGTVSEFIDELVGRWQQTYGEDLTSVRVQRRQ